MRPTPKEQQIKERQSENKEEKKGTSLQEIFEDMRKHRKRKFVDRCDDNAYNDSDYKDIDYDDDDADCFCD